MNFFIKQNSTLPLLKYPLTQKLMEEYDITDDMLEDVAITFSMINLETGIYEIANVHAALKPSQDEYKYALAYNFKLQDTNKPGLFQGEFKIDFLGEEGCGKLTLPTDDTILIKISDSITKTTVVI